MSIYGVGDVLITVISRVVGADLSQSGPFVGATRSVYQAHLIRPKIASLGHNFERVVLLWIAPTLQNFQFIQLFIVDDNKCRG